MYSIENKTEESRVIQNNAEKHVPTAQFKDNRSQNVTEKNTTAQLEKKENLTGMPDDLKEGIESLSGFSMDDVRVHYNSSKPATVQALAYTQGTDIHVAPGQEKHLPHEAWHVAQQMAGRVSPTTNINGMPVNDNAGLEHEADVMGEKAVQCKSKNAIQLKEIIQGVVQRHRWSFYYNNEEVKNLKDLGPDYMGEPESRPLSLEKIKGVMQGRKENSGFYVISVNGTRSEVRKADHDDVMEHLQKSVNIGTEFTFRKKDYKRKLDLSSRQDVPKDVANDYSGFIKVFADQMIIVCTEEEKRSKGFHFTVLESSDDENCKKAKVKGMQLNVPQLPKSKHNFTVNISIDDNCIELQTTPISHAIYVQDYDFIQKLIFESADKVGLEAATDKKDASGKVVQYGGGGHISLDSQSAFAGDVNVLHKFIELYTITALKQVEKKEGEKKEGLFSYNDGVNSPLIRDFVKFRSLLSKCKGNIESYLKDLIEDLYKKGPCPEKVNRSELSHYQAINVDHFLGEGDKSRIEMRNFDAQISIDQLLDQVDALFDILADAYIAKEEQPRTELQPGPSPKPSTSPSPK